MLKGLKEMLKELMDKAKVNQPSIDPMEILNRQDMSLAHRQNRQMLSLGGILSKMSRKLLAKHKKDNVVKVLKKEVDKADKKLKEAREEFDISREEFYEDGTMEGYDFDPYGMELEMLYQTQMERQKLAFQLERRLYDLEKKENPDVEYFVKERDFMKDIDPEERRPGYIDRLDREMDPNNPENYPNDPFGDDVPFAEGGNVDAQMADMMEGPTHTMPDGTVMPGATHGEYEAIMPKEGMVPDEEMEEDYVEFIMSEALEPEEQQYLSERLVEDDQLSMIFDKVVEMASEFSGSGPVDGPGTGISDSIPARLSDGEFVMTAKATDAIGADTLDELMALAEQEADSGRQMKATGGSIKAEPELIPSVIVEEEDPTQLNNKKVMRALDPRISLFAS